MSPRRVVLEELSREKILSTAAEMFVQDGYNAVSMRKIAQALGYSHGAIYYHYKDKGELFGEVITRDFRRLTALIDQTLEATPTPDMTKMENLFVAYIRFGFENKPQYELMFMLEDPVQCTITEKNLSYVKFAETVMLLLGPKHNQTDRATMLPYSVFLSLHGFVAYYLHTEQTFEDVSQQAHVHAKLLYQGLLSMLGS